MSIYRVVIVGSPHLVAPRYVHPVFDLIIGVAALNHGILVVLVEVCRHGDVPASLCCDGYVARQAPLYERLQVFLRMQMHVDLVLVHRRYQIRDYHLRVRVYVRRV